MQGKITKLSMSKFLLTPQNLECLIRSVNHTAPGICKQVLVCSISVTALRY